MLHLLYLMAMAIDMTATPLPFLKEKPGEEPARDIGLDGDAQRAQTSLRASRQRLGEAHDPRQRREEREYQRADGPEGD